MNAPRYRTQGEPQHWTSAAEPELAVTTSGAVPAREVTRAVRAIGLILRRHRLDTAARVRVTAPAAADEPTLVQANIRFRGIPTRVQVCGPGGFAVTFAAERLDRQIDRLATRRVRPWPDPARPPLARVSEPRAVTRRKTCALLMGSPREAAAVLDAMDYDAYLFTDAETGEDAVVHWADPTGIRLLRQRATHPPRGAGLANSPAIEAHPDPAPVLRESDAAAGMCRAGLPFLFFTDARSGRGGLLYRRYDGDLAVVMPERREFH
ncbi:hypothetical protein D5S18_31935 [Nocardia panacis]|uniref:Sigma 54 modulation/S30EA ribosomal protein C-terminal domain-containing protein n=1 Tax=Nocardia panacis TaxID=2340916 RepID=A0A3A4JKY0_9NOCA|nr:sigma 54 modulation/S30EA ribosomal C-terminal domain-containing protein [Nocardia panacis]RJO69255.1 hypothetical protein D5S18_31935 [Nocardia panacis]